MVALMIKQNMRKSAVLFLFILVSTATYLLWIVSFEIEFLSSLFPARKQKLMIVERYYSNRTGKHCDVRFDWCEMCPKLYTELGGRCDLINEAFYCPTFATKQRPLRDKYSLL